MTEDDLAVLYFTGGTTGRPKGVQLTHRNLVANSFHKTIACGLRDSDVFLASGPFFHVAGTAPVLSVIWLGGSLVVLPGFDAGACLDAIEQHGVTVYMPVPTMLAALGAEQKARPRDVSSLRLIGHAGSPITTAVIRDAHETFPAAQLDQYYGATETASILTCLAHEERLLDGGPLGSVGQPVVGVAVNVVDAGGSPCPPGAAGEVVARGPNVTRGYWEDDEATRAAFVDGWYRTGDVGYFDEERNLWLLDRAKDMIVTGGENVYSIEVEEVLARHPAVVECAVFGIPDEQWVEAVHAVVVVGSPDELSDALAEELRDHCRTSIAGFKVPKRIELRTDPLPKSGPGKIQKRQLRDPYWEPASADAHPPILQLRVARLSARSRCKNAVSIVVEAAVEGADAAQQAVAERGLLAGAQVADHARLDLAHLRVTCREQPPALRGQPGLQDPTVLGMGAPADEAAALEGEQDLVHRLRRHERAAGELGVGQAAAAVEHAQRRVLVDREPTRPSPRR